jgi:hypothetical protein
MITCKQAAELISQSLETPLGWRRRWALLLHLGVCDMCRRFRRHLRLVQRAGRLAGRPDPPPGVAPDASLPEAARERLKRALRQRGGHAPG